MGFVGHLRSHPTQAWHIICMRFRGTGPEVGLLKFIFQFHYWIICTVLKFLILGFLICGMRRIREIMHANRALN